MAEDMMENYVDNNPDVQERFRKAGEIRRAMGIYGEGGQTTDDFLKISPVHTQTIMEYCFGMVWAQSEKLDLKTREIIVLATMVAQDLPGELEWHVRSALNLGLTQDEIIEAIVQCSPYVGLPKTNHALRAAKRAFDKAEGKEPSDLGH